MPEAMILAGDVGGTKTHLALFRLSGKQLERVSGRVYPSVEHASLDDIVTRFLQENAAVVACAGFGIAGPVRNDRVRTTNLPWTIEGGRLASILGLRRVALLNDVEANAHGVAALEVEDLATLHEGVIGAEGNAAVISPGTGLGEAGMLWDGERHRPFATEGGHASFAPQSDLEWELLRYLRPRFGHVSWERVVSGPGLMLLYEFFRDRAGGAEPPWFRERVATLGGSAAITEVAREGSFAPCADALALFVRLLGAEAGNLALKTLALGGVWVGGGIAPKILPTLKEGTFVDAFLDKGRMRLLLQAVPVRVILNEQAALLGAARSAAVCCGAL